MNISAIAIDDEPRALEVIEIHAQKVPFLELKATFTDAFEAIPYLQQNKIDLIFLDIKMPDISGLEFVGILQKSPMIIFTTAYSEYAVNGFELDAVDYLLKPFSLVRFTKACNKALEIKTLKNGATEQDFIFIKTGYEEEKVLFDDILYIEAEGNYMAYVLANRKLLCRQNISDCINQLPSNQFVRIHRSFIIAYNKVQKITRQSVWVAGNEISIGASYEEKIPEIRQRLGL
ncbi:two component transcriptional regulator, LytTR family [Emticicia oligotrophica DSM 17448]|uniref:Two component transcriptional regulator, LytTR family n=1 Tax=Emticicia oligotrophica (strain DSM 17448 / CIP 109782 / MTCC 6937 / GPTSA100-15) TaxID=929562 RepID=A0ABN4AP17_EMTOG|nr:MULTISPECIES: LytTR family DNA-binding domain-containing protein [Emticicia]AFK04084.1 two component transcriptional regulator, LytTR family [Emticicia oligotrophica DSM 17448]